MVVNREDNLPGLLNLALGGLPDPTAKPMRGS